jgi:HTH-type transcriptional regulator, competence development regulator
LSPTYLSKVERDEFTPPTEVKVRAIAQIIECDPDELLAMAGRVPSDLADIIKQAVSERRRHPYLDLHPAPPRNRKMSTQ